MKVFEIEIKNKLKNQNVFADLRISGLDTTLSDQLYEYLKDNTAVFLLKNVTLFKGKLTYDDDFSCYKEKWSEILPTNVGRFIFSESIKNLINSRLTGNEGLVWINVLVTQAEETRPYFIITFDYKHDILDLQKTIFHEHDKEYIIIPYFSKEKMINYSLFCKPHENWYLPTNVFIVESIVNEIKELKLPNIKFEEYTKLT